MAMKRHDYILRLLLVMSVFLIPSLVRADNMIPDPAAQKWFNNLLLGCLFVVNPLFGALGGVVLALIYRLRRAEFITAVVAMALASVISAIVTLVAPLFIFGFGSDSPEPSPVWFYMAWIIIGWPFGIFVLRHKKRMIWNGLLASVIAWAVTFGVDKILLWVRSL